MPGSRTRSVPSTSPCCRSTAAWGLGRSCSLNSRPRRRCGAGCAPPCRVVGIGGTPDGSTGHVTGYVSVDDIDAVLARAVELGGAVVMPKFSPGPNAVVALVADAEGHVVGLSE